MLPRLISLLPDQVLKLMCDQHARTPLSLCNCVVNIDIICPGEFLPICKSVTKNSHSCPLHSHPSVCLSLTLSLLFFFSPLSTSRGRWGVGERPFLRVSHAALQSHPQLAGALPHEPQLRSHRQVVRQALREGREAHQQEVSRLHVFLLQVVISFTHTQIGVFVKLCLLMLAVMWSGAAQWTERCSRHRRLQFYVLFSVLFRLLNQHFHS